jgi:hypothetical protein
MYFGIYNAETGIIRKCLEGPSPDWAALNAADGELVIQSAELIDDAAQAVDVSAEPHTLVERAYVPGPEELQIIVARAVQNRLDAFAQSRGYDGILSAATYATSSVPQFADEGQYAVQVRDATWSALYTILAEVQAGTRPLPAGYGDIDGELPALAWP